MLLALVVPSSGPITCTAYAGDLLRGGYTVSQGGNTSPGSFTAPSVAKARQQASDLLARTTQAIQSVSAMQSKARQLAIARANSLGVNPNNTSQMLPTVVDGLNTGGLVPDSGLQSAGVANAVSDWQNATTPTQTTNAKGRTTVNVDQTGADALLYWNSFNIGKNTTLDINQSAGGRNEDTWIAFNMIEDPSGVPSQILGSIKAGGQVYVIDQNGIIFGGSSQVNVHTLVASSLPIDTYLIGHGLLNNPDDQFLFSALAQPAGVNGSPAMSAATGVIGDVTVDAGAQIYAPANADNVGGRVALIGPNVTNDGTISTPDGQTILAAGLQVGFVASSDPTLRGLDVYVGAISGGAYPSTESAGTVINGGLINVPSGDVSMTGAAVDQFGVVATTTSVTLNGRIDLNADYDSASGAGVPDVASFFPQLAGAVELGANSVTDVLPEASTATVVLSGFTLNSEVNIQGKTIHMDGESTLWAPGATVNLDAGVWDYFLVNGNPGDPFVHTGGQIYLDSGAIIDAAGSSDVQASVDQNIISVQLLGPELADSPSQRNGPFVGQTIYVDIRDTGSYNGVGWVGTPLVDDVESFVDLIPYTAAELTIDGGQVNMTAGGSVVMQRGSEVNVAGGWIDYQGGTVTTSEVISGGNIYPISQAYPDLVYQGFNLGTFNIIHPKYAVTQTYDDPILDLSHYEDSYVDGGNGGSISITSPSVALDGQLLGSTVAGPRQQSINTTTPNSLTVSSMPTASALTLEFEQEQVNGFAYTEDSPTPPAVIVSANTPSPAAPTFAAATAGSSTVADWQKEVVLSPNLFNSDGFGFFDLDNGDGNVTIPAGVAISLPPGGLSTNTNLPPPGITISAANLYIGGSITAPDATLDFKVYDFSPFTYASTLLNTTPPVDPNRGHFTLAAGASLDTAGLTVDDRDGAPDADLTPQVTQGGSITIDSYSMDLAAGSVINVSGGVILSSNATPEYGDAGTITIAGGQDPNVNTLLNGNVNLGAELEGYSGAKGGTLGITAQFVQVGGDTAVAHTQIFSPSFFDQGGFSSFLLNGVGGLTIEPGTVVDPVDASLVATDGNQIQLVPTVLPAGQRAPVNLSFQAQGLVTLTGNPIYIGSVLVGSGAVVETEPSATSGATVSLSGGTVAVLGSVIAPGGSISVKGSGNSTGIFLNATGQVVTVDLGPHSLLSTAGLTVLTPNAYGYTTGDVLNGGSITVSGNFAAEAGSVIDVSGANSVLDRTPVQADVNAMPDGSASDVQDGSLLGMLLAPTEVDSSGGTITLKGGYEAFDDATLLGAAGGPSATGGNLSISSDVGLEPNPLSPNLLITQSAPAIPKRFYPSGQDAIGYAVVDAQGNALSPMGYFTVHSFAGGGFDNVTLAGTVQFSGGVSISVPGSLTVATGGVIIADSPVNLAANYVALGIPFVAPTQPQLAPPPYSSGGAFNFDPTYGTGVLNVKANLIDIGNLSLQDIGKANFIADGGDIRGDGTLDVDGSIFMKAGQVYAPTEVTFTIAAFDIAGSVAVASSAATSNIVTLASATVPDGFGVGSTLLGSTVQAINGATVTLASDADATVQSSTSESWASPDSGSITFAASGTRELPLSAGGILDVYASNIVQDGVLRAPMGTINLGWDGSGTAPVDAVTNGAMDVTESLTLGAGSITSVSAVDPVTGQALIIPYGTNPDGTSWIDPSGQDITAGGVPQKSISISAINVKDEHGAVIDIKGGGDLLTYQFLPGTGGDNDILGYSSSFAIIPGYQAGYAPYDTDSGYNNASLVPGDRVYLNASPGLAAGYYTLLPARYALLPGAFLVTPQNSANPLSSLPALPVGPTQPLPDGGSLVSGYRVSAGESAAPETTNFEVDSSSVVGTLADYTVYSGNSFFTQGALLNGQSVPRLPRDSGEVEFLAVNSLTVSGAVNSTPLSGGLGGLVDISSPDDIVITGANSTTPPSNTLVLNANELNSFGAASLLIGGTRTTGADGVTVSVTTQNITVDNGDDPLTGSDIILAANDNLTVDQGSEIEAAGASSGAQAITLNGDGALLRVSSDPDSTVTRTGVTTTSAGQLTVDADTKITGASITLDSASGTHLDPDASVEGKSVALDSGQITIELADPGTVAATTGLVLSGAALQAFFGGAESLSLLSYSSIDIYGSGDMGATAKDGQAILANLTLSAGEINGLNSAGGTVSVAAQNILLDNSANAPGNSAPSSASGGTLDLNANTITLGANSLAVDQFANVDLNAADRVYAGAKTTTPQGASASVSPSFSAQGNLTITSPLITGAAGAVETVSAASYSSAPAGATGNLDIAMPTVTPAAPSTAGGLGASLIFIGASSLTDNGSITAHSGSLTLEASTGSLTLGNLSATSLDVSGQSKTFFNITEYTNAGQIDLIADQGSVDVDADATISVAYDTAGKAGGAGGNAGMLTIDATQGSVALLGTLLGLGGAGKENGSFSLDAASIPAAMFAGTAYGQGSLDPINAILDAGAFTQSISIRDQTDANVFIGSQGAANEPTVTADAYHVTADIGSITVYGTINAADVASTDPFGQPISIGGSITLQAGGSVTLASGGELTVAAQNFSNAQEGGAISLEAGSDINGVASTTGYVNIDAGSTIDLSVAAAAVQGDRAGTLLLRAPQIGSQSDPTGVQVGAIDGDIIGSTTSAAPSTITVEGYTIFNTATDGSQGNIDNDEGNVAANGSAFANNTGSYTVSGNTVTGSGIEGGLLSGNLALANALTSGATQLVIEPGAEIINPDINVNDGDLTLNNTWQLSQSNYRFGPDGVAGVLTLRAVNSIVFDYGASLSDGFVYTSNASNLWEANVLAVGSTSWSYQITAGADFSSADVAAVQSQPTLALISGPTGNAGSVLIGYGAPALPTDETLRKAVIPDYFQTIRTGAGSIAINAGGDVQLLDSLATVYSAGTQAPALAGFTLPVLSYPNNVNYDVSPQIPFYPAYYTEDGGNVSIVAQDDIAHYLQNGGELVPDSSLELPDNWLYRQGAVNSTTGKFTKATSWWSDFSNFLEGVGAFGGGNVTLAAGNDIANVDAVIPTNARMPNGTPNASSLLELGGGDLVVSAGDDISGGVYYVERGQGTISAGDEIETNVTRSTETPGAPADLVDDPSTWLPTTLFAGQASFNITAGGSVLLGSVANPFLLAPGVNNSYLDPSFFSTYAASDSVTVESLSGSITIKNGGAAGSNGSLQNFLFDVDSQASNPNSYAANDYPWLSIADTDSTTFNTVDGVMPPTLLVTAFSGSVNLAGSLVLSPAPDGTLDVLAAGSINALQINGIQTAITGNVSTEYEWSIGLIDLSDADPASIPSITSPYSSDAQIAEVDTLFTETGSSEGAASVIQAKEALHDPGLLHKDDPNPVHVYAEDGGISGLTLFSGKLTDVIASQNITDVAFYIQNVNASDISVVSAGVDMILYDPNSPLENEAASTGNVSVSGPAAGDLQINGPGTLEVLAGRNLTLGIGANNSDGTAVGITSVGQARDPYLPSEGAQLIVAAGLGGVADGLDESSLDIPAFVNQVIDGPDGASYFSELAATDPTLDDTTLQQFKTIFADPADGQIAAAAALNLFYIVLRDAGRDHNLVGNPGYGNYAAGMSAIQSLLPKLGAGTGDIDVTSKEITTVSGGDIDILDPSGQLTVGVNLAGAQPVEQGIFTDDGGNISMFTLGSVNIGTSRIFTLQGGNVIIWSSEGDIDAGNSSKTVQSAPPTRVLIDPQSANVETDLAGLATGGGIGVLATVVGVPPGDVDLIAPTGTINAGDAGIRATGNLNLAAVQILNASNISAGGSTSGVPTVAVAAPNLGALAAASSAAGASTAQADQQTNAQNQQQSNGQGADSIFDVEVLGYGGGDSSDDSGG